MLRPFLTTIETPHSTGDRGWECVSVALRDPPDRTSAAAISIAVIVPVRNEEPFIARTLEALLAQDFPRDAYEIIVLDGQSTDGTAQIVGDYARRHANIRLYDNPNRWSSSARNLAIRSTTASVVLIVDGHCELTDTRYLSKVVAAFERSSADCLGRPQPLTIAAASPLQRAIGLARRCWLGHHPASYVFSSGDGFVPAKSVAVAYRREVFDRVGLFDDAFDACEDVELNYRIDAAGLVCYWTDEIALPYVPRRSLGGLFRQLKRYGCGRVRLLRKHPHLSNLKALTPALLVCAALAGAIAAASFPFLVAPYLTILALYLVVLTVTAFCVASRARQLLLSPLVVAALLAIHAGAGWGVLSELLFSGFKSVFRTIRSSKPA
jgi:succinoglycan biosynthesis protein ExoA